MVHDLSFTKLYDRLEALQWPRRVKVTEREWIAITGVVSSQDPPLVDYREGIIYLGVTWIIIKHNCVGMDIPFLFEQAT